MNKVIIIAGPTATGKSNLAIEVAKKCNAEVVNFDSLLFYNDLNIGTAKPSKKELEIVPHHMINCREITNAMNAHDYSMLAQPIIKEIHHRNKMVILVGGSGFYLQALLYGMFDSKTSPPEIIEKSNALYESEGIKPFREFLKKNDFQSYENYHENDHYRIRRAVEHFWTTQTPFSLAREKMLEERSLPADWNIHFGYFDIPKEEHYSIIQQRTQTMFDQGIIAEVKTLLSKGLSGDEKPLKSIGYKEVIELLRGEIDTPEACIEKINISTRQLAKSQRTWFKKIDKIEYNPLRDKEKFINDCLKFYNG